MGLISKDEIIRRLVMEYRNGAISHSSFLYFKELIESCKVLSRFDDDCDDRK